MDCSTTGFPVHHQLPELTQTHVHRVSDAIWPSHPLLSFVLNKLLPSEMLCLEILFQPMLGLPQQNVGYEILMLSLL